MLPKPKPRVKFNSLGPSGNIYCVMGRVKRALLLAHREEEWTTIRERMEQEPEQRKTYDRALSIFREYVDLIDISGAK